MTDERIEVAIRAAHEAGRRAGRDEMRAEMERDALVLDAEHAAEVAEWGRRVRRLERAIADLGPTVVDCGC
jgi:hypothetical protein